MEVSPRSVLENRGHAEQTSLYDFRTHPTSSTTILDAEKHTDVPAASNPATAPAIDVYLRSVQLHTIVNARH